MDPARPQLPVPSAHAHKHWLPSRGASLTLPTALQIEVDPARRMARVQPGVSTRELSQALLPHGLHFPGGHISHVGLSGFILGGLVC